MQAIANFPEATENYTFVQSVERMRRLRRPLMVEGIVSGFIFCNFANINIIAPDLRNIRVAGCDSTFKIVLKFLENDAY
ncbi:Uncharacterized protein FWK35_00009073 [Aphis craccivora]|uniref:Uncharacterized protein n=1 Tax=Aphis craccivora TaxID=307492 RepID=A0A6G0YQ53_APHCR|nr:Uncharacterized protein FWK35_00009073 [Aphis craccivora]